MSWSKGVLSENDGQPVVSRRGGKIPSNTFNVKMLSRLATFLLIKSEGTVAHLSPSFIERRQMIYWVPLMMMGPLGLKALRKI